MKACHKRHGGARRVLVGMGWGAVGVALAVVCVGCGQEEASGPVAGGPGPRQLQHPPGAITAAQDLEAPDLEAQELSGTELRVPEDAPSIQQAIDQAGPGDVVRVAAGEYAERLTLREGVHIRGAGRDDTLIRADVFDGPVLTATNVHGGSISGIGVTHLGEWTHEELYALLEEAFPEDGEEPDLAELPVQPLLVLRDSSILVEDCFFFNSPGEGIAILGGQPLIQRCRVEYVHRRGISASGPGTRPRIVANEVIGTAGMGVRFGDGAGGAAVENTIRRTNASALLAVDPRTSPQLQDNILEDNYFYPLFIDPEASPWGEGNRCRGNAGVQVQSVRWMFEQRDFDALEHWVRDLREQDLVTETLEPLLAIFYEGFIIPEARRKAYPASELAVVFDEWATAWPESVMPYMGLARLYHNYAWDARGDGYAYTVTEEGWRDFHHYIALAWDVFEEAEAAVQERDGQFYTFWADVATGQPRAQTRGAMYAPLFEGLRQLLSGPADPNQEIARIFREGADRFPGYLPLYRVRAFTLLPRWYGGPGDVEAFLREEADRLDGSMGDKIYALVTAYLSGRYVSNSEFMERHAFEWERVERGHRALLEDYPTPFNMNRFLRIACNFQEAGVARELFMALENEFDEEIWGNWFVFDAFQKWAFDGAPYPTANPIATAAVWHDASRVEQRIAEGYNVDALEYELYTPLHGATTHGRLEIVEVLLAHGASPNIPDHTGAYPLHIAIINQHWEITNRLLEHGAEADRPGREGWYALELAIQLERWDLALELIELGADVNAGSEGRTPLMLAVNHRNYDFVSALLDLGADPNTVSGQYGPLHLAAELDDAAMAGLLLERGAGIDVQANGSTALHWAARASSPELIMLLLEAEGAGPNIRSESGATPLHFAASRGDEAILELLIGAGADPTAEDSDGELPAEVAAEHGHPAAAAYLEAHAGQAASASP